MTGISSFFAKSQSHSFTIKDATLITIIHKHGRMDADKNNKRKDVPPNYPEPDGDPSY